MMRGLALITACILGETARELCFKQAARGRALARSPALWAGLFLWAAEALLWIVTLQHMALAVAIPLMALSFATVPLAAQMLLRERLRAGQLFGIVLISAGAMCVGLSGSLS